MNITPIKVGLGTEVEIAPEYIAELHALGLVNVQSGKGKIIRIIRTGHLVTNDTGFEVMLMGKPVKAIFVPEPGLIYSESALTMPMNSIRVLNHQRWNGTYSFVANLVMFDLLSSTKDLYVSRQYVHQVKQELQEMLK